MAAGLAIRDIAGLISTKIEASTTLQHPNIQLHLHAQSIARVDWTWSTRGQPLIDDRLRQSPKSLRHFALASEPRSPKPWSNQTPAHSASTDTLVPLKLLTSHSLNQTMRIRSFEAFSWWLERGCSWILPTYNSTSKLISSSVSKLGLVQKFLWTNAGFNGLRKLKHLKEYTERWDVSLRIPDYDHMTNSSSQQSFP